MTNPVEGFDLHFKEEFNRITPMEKGNRFFTPIEEVIKSASKKIEKPTKKEVAKNVLSAPARFLTRFIDRLASQKTVSQPPEDLSIYGKKVWAQTADMANSIIEGLEFPGHLGEYEKILAKSFLQHEIVEEKLKISKETGTYLEVVNSVKKQPAEFIKCFALEKGWDLQNPETTTAIANWCESIKSLAETLNGRDLVPIQILEKTESIKENRKHF